MTELRVRKDTDTVKLASAIFSNMKNMKKLELTCLGVGPVNQALKGFINAKSLAAQVGMVLHIDPIYRNAVIDNEKEEKTLMVMVITKDEEE